jgi:protocatechuate 3,4-dioxygenase, alpha subunit
VSLGRTPSQTVGPYYAIGLCGRPDNELVARDYPGALPLEGALFDGQGEPINDGLIELWDASGRRWGRCGTDPSGAFSFIVAKPEAAVGAPHLEVTVFSRGLLRHQLTRVYFPDEREANEADPVLSRLRPEERATLLGAAEDGGVRFDIHMQGPDATAFFEH